jgi:predicted LPLAT superfamily acyltransferase
MKASWRAQRERGSRALMAALAWTTLALGRTFGRLFLPPISLYFLAFAPRARAASAAYLARMFGRPARTAEVYRHIHTFACNVHDRVLLLAGRLDAFEFEVENEAHIWDALAEHRRGCLLLGSHLGSFEVLRAVAARQDVHAVRILMETENAARIQSVLHRIHPSAADWIIQLGAPTTLLQVRESLERNEVVGILADRVWREDRTMSVPFLGAPAKFPLGPFRLAHALRAPAVFGVGLFRGGNRYTLHFERLDAAPGAMTAAELLAAYVARLEHYCRLAPYNWFNFYDFWGDPA